MSTTDILEHVLNVLTSTSNNSKKVDRETVIETAYLDGYEAGLSEAIRTISNILPIVANKNS